MRIVKLVIETFDGFLHVTGDLYCNFIERIGNVCMAYVQYK